MLSWVVTLQTRLRQSHPSFLLSRSPSFCRPLFSITSNMLFLQTLSFHIHTKKHPGVGGKATKHHGRMDRCALAGSNLAGWAEARRLHSWAERVKDCAEDQPEG
jgi:hypothetical protein